MTAAGKKRILVVDDEEGIRAYLRRILEEEGYAVTIAGSATVAAEALREGGFDLVITDIMMPGKDGIELIADIKARSPAVRVMAISGVERKTVLLEVAQALEADVTLEKPFDRLAALSAVKKALA